MSNNSGIGNQTRRLCQMLKPFRIMAIDSTNFSKNKEQHWNWYDGFTGYKINGFPSNHEVDAFLKGLTHVLCVENPFSFYLLKRAKMLGIKVYIQTNYEFCDHLCNNIELPTKFLMPSYWMLQEMKARFGPERVEYLPPPLDPAEFKHAREVNFLHAGPRQFLHIVGTLAVHDRNGTLDLLHALQYSRGKFTLTIRSQHPLPAEYSVDDYRVRYVIEDAQEPAQMYEGYDALIMPRRYGGLTLSMNEALMSGLPVIMTDISPNNMILPKDWLVEAGRTGSFMARTSIDIYASNLRKLGEKIDWLVNQDLDRMKTNAFNLAHKTFAPSSLKVAYDRLWI